MRASETDRALHCPHSLVAPRTLIRRVKSDEAADTGTLLHTWKETGEEHPAIASKVIRSAVRREDYWPEEYGEHEVTFAIELYSMQIKRWSKRTRKTADAWKKTFDPKRWLTGTIDWLGIHEGRPWVDDLKTGNWPVDPLTGQLLSYALVPWVEAGFPSTGMLVERSITWWPWYPLDGWPRRAWADPATGLDLTCHHRDLVYAVEHPNEANVVPPVFHPTKRYKDGRRAVEEMSPCTFCDARESHAYTPWMQHFQERALPTCLKGAVQHLFNKGDTE